MTTYANNTQLNLRIISIVVFTCICYLSIGLPLAVLPGFIHYHLGYSTLVAGAVISLQYISTLVSRPHAGRYTDIWGPKKVVSLGIICCMLSGLFTLAAAAAHGSPLLAVTMLLVGRVFLGVGESFTSTGSTLWGIKTVGAVHTSRVISWNGVATYVAMAAGAPLGVMLNDAFGISGFAALIVIISVVGLLFARTRADVSVSAGVRAPFHVVARKIWPYGLGLGLGTVGFGSSRRLSRSTSPPTAGRVQHSRCHYSASALSVFVWYSATPSFALAVFACRWSAICSNALGC